MTGLKELIQAFGGLIQIGTVILAGAAVLIFMWGLAKFIFKIGSSEKAVEEGRNIMVWGLIALFVMTSVWGIIFFFQNELNLPGAERGISPPRGNFPTPGNQPEPGILPSRGNFPWPGNQPEPGILPSQDKTWFFTSPSKAPVPGNLPQAPAKPWYYFGISF